MSDEQRSVSERAHLVIAGHVDHGKSTIIGRLLADTGTLPEGKLEQIRQLCDRNSKPFEFAFLLDALKDEQAQGITIDAARVFFKTAKRDYIIMDAPGHVEFLKNMITGASRADAALLVIDAREGVQENSRRHCCMLAMLGVTQVAILVNKMDLVDYSEAAFRGIVREMADFLGKIDVVPAYHIPVSGRTGDNIAAPSTRMPWYTGPTVLGALDAFHAEPRSVEKPFRMPVQGVYKFTKDGDDRRIVGGTVESGRLRVGDPVVFYPSGKRTRIASFEMFGGARPMEVSAGEAVGFTLGEQIYAARGEIAVRADEPPPHVSTRLRVSLFWLGRSPLVQRKEYLLKLGTVRVPMRVESVHRVIDPTDLSAAEGRHRVERHEVAECTLRLSRAIAFDIVSEIGVTGRFVIVDDHDIRGGGIIREALEDEQTGVREKVLVRNYKWEASRIPPERRAEKYNQRPVLLLITGERTVDRKGFAKELEARLFDDGRIVYFLGIGNVLYGVDADIEWREENRVEHFRRLGEVANLMLDAGVILIVTAAELEQRDVDIIKTSVDPGRIETIWIGERVTTDIEASVVLPVSEAIGDEVQRLKTLLQDKGIVFRPW